MKQRVSFLRQKYPETEAKLRKKALTSIAVWYRGPVTFWLDCRPDSAIIVIASTLSNVETENRWTRKSDGRNCFRWLASRRSASTGAVKSRNNCTASIVAD